MRLELGKVIGRGKVWILSLGVPVESHPKDPTDRRNPVQKGVNVHMAKRETAPFSTQYTAMCK